MNSIVAFTGPQINSIEAKTLAHDLRSPLSALKLTTQALALGKDAQLLIEQSLTSIEKLISRVSMLGQTNFSQQTQLARPYHITQRCLERLGPSFAAKGVTLYADLDPKTAPHLCPIDELDFERALINLLQNSLEALTEKGNQSVHVRLKLKKKTLRLFIEDSGKGIPSEILGQITAPGMTYGKQDGSGYGLHQAKQAIEKSGGRLLISSEEGKGTIITLDLPFSAPILSGEIGPLRLCC
jgi:signal transduction histidine kinase